MDFKQTVQDMLKHLESDPTDEAFDALTTALGTGLATLIGTSEKPDDLMTRVFSGIAAAAFAAHEAANSRPLTPLEVLQKFKPEKLNG